MKLNFYLIVIICNLLLFLPIATSTSIENSTTVKTLDGSIMNAPGIKRNCPPGQKLVNSTCRKLSG